MTYDEKIPAFALQPAKPADEKKDEQIDTQMKDDGFDPTPYDRLLVPKSEDEEIKEEGKEEIVPEEAEPKETPEKRKAEIEEQAEKSEEDIEGELEPVVFEKEEQEETAIPVSGSVKVIPLENAAVYKDLKIKTVAQKLETTIYVEEDILVPDVKPDLASILSMDGRAILSSKEIQVGQEKEDSVRVTGEVALQTIYLPETKEEGEEVSIIQSRLPFKTDWQVTASPMSSLSIVPTIEEIQYTIVNERKFRAKASITLSLAEYAEKELSLFDNIRNEDLELLKETIKMSHVSFRKEETAEISEDLAQKDGGLKPVKILKSDIHVLENHKQITSEKMVINANIFANILYIGEEEKDGETVRRPAFYQGKTDFTQFILMDKEENTAMSKAYFDGNDLEVKINEDETGFTLKGTVNTTVEVMTNLEKEVVTDFYNNTKDMTYDASQDQIEAIVGTGITEASAREIFNVPETNGQIEQVIYINGRIKEYKNTVEQGRVMVEGTVEGQIICLPEEEDRKAFSIKQDLPFRGTMEIAAAQQNMGAESQVAIKDLWFDKINGKQVEVNASLQIETAVVDARTLTLIKNPCFVEDQQTKRPSSMVIYVTRKDDSLWKIAKKYKIGMNAIREVNQLQEGSGLKEGTRLLIVK